MSKELPTCSRALLVQQEIIIPRGTDLISRCAVSPVVVQEGLEADCLGSLPAASLCNVCLSFLIHSMGIRSVLNLIESL